jgi:uncharacterized protein
VTATRALPQAAPADSGTKPPLHPASEGERLHALDAIRGAAILGVLLAYTIWNLGGPPEEEWTRLDHLVARGMDLFVDGKCYTLFACLFGLGVFQQWGRWEAAGYDPTRLHLRRMGFLLGVGLLHAVLLRNGDILAHYAVVGFALLAFRTLSNRIVATAGVTLLLVTYLIEPAVRLMGMPWPERPTGSTGSYLAENFAWLRYWYATNPFRDWTQILGLMLLGVTIGRFRVVERLMAGRRTILLLAAALLLWILLRAGYDQAQASAVTGIHPLWRSAGLRALYDANTWCLAAAYGVAMILMTRRSPALLWPLRAQGRMAFSNYLMQPILIVPLCLVFGLFDTFTPSRGLWLGLAVGTLQVAFSMFWLRRHPLGPLERVWRVFTYRPRGGG